MDNEAAGTKSSIRQDHDQIIEMPDEERNRDEETRQLVSEIEGMLAKLEKPPPQECCIYRVPKIIRKVNEEAYTPHLVSIGPFHRDNEELIKSMDQVKKRFMNKLVKRSGNSNLGSYIKYVKKEEGSIRDCYSEHIDMNSDDFVKMIVVDGCFIIELLLNSFDGTLTDDDHWLLQPRVICTITLDLILLENQIPFFVLEKLLSLATTASSESYSTASSESYFTASSESYSLLHLSLDFFQCFLNQYNQVYNPQSVMHFTHLVLTSYRPPPPSSPLRKQGRFQSLRSSTELNETGVTFKAISSNLCDIKFTSDCVLLIPSFKLYDRTETEVRNLMALELCHCPNDSFLTDYMVFMDCLINTTRDIDLLVHNDIIENWLGDSKAAVNLFNNLCTNVTIVKFNFSQVSEKLNVHYKDRKHKLKAILKRDYFHTPWQTASTIAAVMLLILTLIQAVYSILSFVYSN